MSSQSRANNDQTVLKQKKNKKQIEDRGVKEIGGHLCERLTEGVKEQRKDTRHRYCLKVERKREAEEKRAISQR